MVKFERNRIVLLEVSKIQWWAQTAIQLNIPDSTVYYMICIKYFWVKLAIFDSISFYLSENFRDIEDDFFFQLDNKPNIALSDFK